MKGGILLRRSSRFRKNVKFYGDVVQYMSHGRTSRGKKQKRLIKRKLHPTTEISQVSLLSLGKLHKSKEGRSQTNPKIDDIMKLLKQRGCVLPAIRCINTRTGERQIGVPRKISQITRSKLKSESPSNVSSLLSSVNSPTIQAEAIFENLVSLVPLEPNPNSLKSMNKFYSQMMQNINKNSMFPLQTEIKQEDNLSNDDSKYQWL